MDFFYRHKPWYAGQFVRKITPKIDIAENSILFFTVILNKQKKNLLSILVRDVDKTFKSTRIKLPITSKGKIDFDFMESVIAGLEAERIAELKAYLLATGLNDYQLTKEEEKALENYDSIKWGKFRVEKLFKRIKTRKLPYKAKDLPNQPTGKHTLPCLTSSFNNQGLNYYAPRKGATILKNVISIPSNSDVYRAYFQPNEFTVLSDAYAIRWIFNGPNLSPNQYLFCVQSINKVTDLSIYSYKNKLGGWNIVKDKHIVLPLKNDVPDYDLMEILISAIKKLVTKGVVLYTDRKIASTRK